MTELRKRLEEEAARRDRPDEIDPKRPDPLLVARRYEDPTIALICALFAYGSAKQIVAFLEGLDFSLLKAPEARIRRELKGYYYRFQRSEDLAELFVTLRRMGEECALQEPFMKGYLREGSVLEGLAALIAKLRSLNPYRSYGYDFLLSHPPTPRTRSPYKRWNMYLRWMVRKDSIDMGLWSGVRRKDLLIPLDTHTFHVSRRLGLLTRKQCDLKAAVELTERLKAFDPEDPVRFDFALYRLGQEKRA